jgi:ERCC4-type nuclease
LFLSHRSHTPARLSPLTAADFCFTISGPGNLPTLLGIERKTLPDLISSLRTHRLSGEQIPKLLDHYSPHAYLLIEGDYRVNTQSGFLQIRRRIQGEGRGGGQGSKWGWGDVLYGQQTVLAAEIDNALSTITEKTGVMLWRTRDENETVDWVVNKFQWGEKDWDRHRAHTGIYSKEPYVGTEKASDVRRFAFALKGSPGEPGIGWEKSGAVEERFKTIAEAVAAPVEEWMKIDGFGKVLATRIWKRLRGIHE